MAEPKTLSGQRWLCASQTGCNPWESSLNCCLVSPLPFFLEPVFTKYLSHTHTMGYQCHQRPLRPLRPKSNGRFKVLIFLDLSAALDIADPINWNTCFSWLPNYSTRLVYFRLTGWPYLAGSSYLLAWNCPWVQHKLFYLLYSLCDLSWAHGLK